MSDLYDFLAGLRERPSPFSRYTAPELWTDEHTSAQMLAYHLNPDLDVSSRKHAFIERSCQWISRRFALGPGKSVIDFGCGPGLYASHLAATGAAVTGVDFSPRSIAHAREQASRDGRPITYVNADYLEFESDARFDLVTLIMCDLCALSPQQRARLLRKFRALLAPGGAVLLDAYSLGAFASREEAATYEFRQLGGFWAPGDYFGFVDTFKYDDVKVVLDRYTIVEPARTRQVFNWLQYFSPETLEAECAAQGLRVDAVHANVAGEPHDAQGDEFAVVLRA